ncbi:MAG: ATP-binding protein, partial [Verrucomicrobiota bacterium]
YIMQQLGQKALHGQQVHGEQSFRGRLNEVHLTPVFDADGQQKGVIGFTLDVHDHVEQERSSRVRDKALELILRTLARSLVHSESSRVVEEGLAGLGRVLDVDRVYIFTSERDFETGKRYFSQKWEWSVSSVESFATDPRMQRVSMKDLLPGFEQSLKRNEPVRVRRDRAPESFAKLMERQNIVSLLAVPIQIEGRLWGFIGLDHCSVARPWTSDEVSLLMLAGVTLAALSEKEKLMQQLGKASRAKTEFLAMMSHEIRTPMNAVIGFADLLLGTDLDEEQSEFVNSIMLGSETLLGIINDILDYSKLGSEKVGIFQQPFDPREAAERAVEPYLTEADSKNLEFKLEFDPSLPATLMSDPQRFRQVISNLTSNAVRYTRKGQVRVRLDWVTSTEDGSVVKLIVADTGIGIPEARRSWIFNPFEQGSPGISSEGRSTGLGLPITRRVIDLMGGDIHCESTEGKGTTFTAVIPAELPGPEYEEEKNQIERDEEELRILCAEDEPGNQEVLRNFIRRPGHKALIVETGEEVLEVLRQKTFDLVLMDVRLPGIDGLETTRRIRDGKAGDAARDLPIIGLTANALGGDRRECEKAGMNDYLPKPIKRADFEANLRKYSRQPA